MPATRKVGLAGRSVMSVQAWRRRWHPRSRPGGSRQRLSLLGDAAFALVLVVVSVAVAVLRPGIPHRGVMVFLALLQTLPLALRRRAPLGVLAVVAAASAAATITSGTLIEPLGLLVALYTVAAHCSRRDAARAGIAAAVVLAWPLLRDSGYNPRTAALKLGFLAAGWMVGAYLGELRARAAGNQREQELQTARAVAEEQARVGRELHDVLAHTLAVIVVQAAAAADVFGSSPDRARQALGSIEAASRAALAELRQVLDAVRPGQSQPGQLAPQPGLARLDSLIGQVRGTGLAVTMRIEGTGAELPAGVDLSAYRIVQEALTNTIKHAQANTAEVVLHYRPRELIIDVLDDGRARPETDPGTGAGHGLIGMRERAAIYDGNLTAGPRPGGGFQVHASFPLPLDRPRQ